MNYHAYGNEHRLPYRKYADYAAIEPATTLVAKHTPLIAPVYARESGRSGQASQSPQELMPVRKKIKNLELQMLPVMGTSDFLIAIVGFTRWVSTSSPPTSFEVNTHDSGNAPGTDMAMWDRRFMRPSLLARNPNWQAPHVMELPAIDIGSNDYLYLTVVSQYKSGGPLLQCHWKWAELQVPE